VLDHLDAINDACLSVNQWELAQGTWTVDPLGLRRQFGLRPPSAGVDPFTFKRELCDPPLPAFLDGSNNGCFARRRLEPRLSPP